MAHREFYVIIRTTDPQHWTNHQDFVGGKLYASRSEASSALAYLSPASRRTPPPHSRSSASSSPSSSPGPAPSSANAMPNARAEAGAGMRSQHPHPRKGSAISIASATSTGSEAGSWGSETEAEGEAVVYEVRKIAARSLMAGVSWWFVDG